MPLQQQVCSLELAQKLKELGVKQESLFYWYYVKNLQSWEIFSIHEDVLRDKDDISAFTVAELGEMLPGPLTYKGYNTCLIKSFKIDDTFVSAIYNLDGEHMLWIEADTEADARAKMLIYLLENNLLK